jgi:hypothetical protein
MAQYRKDIERLLESNKSIYEVNMISSKDGEPVSKINPFPTMIEWSDSSSVSAFGRARVANTRLLGEFRNFYGTTGLNEIETKFENGGTQTVNLTQKFTNINVTTAENSRALRQSRQYHPYIAGTNNIGLISFTFGESKENLQQLVGMFDDDNGILLRLNGNIPEFIIRKGGVDSELVAIQDWNYDKFDGTGPSGKFLDLTKSQILAIDYQWLGVGRVRIGFNISGKIHYGHYFDHANSIAEPYLYQPSLPVRWEIKNIGATESVSSMMCIGYSVYVEGADDETGFTNSISNGTGAGITLTENDTDFGILAVRMKNSVNGIPVKAFARLKEWEVYTTLDAGLKILILPGAASISGTPIWNSVSNVSWCEYTTNFSLANIDSRISLYEGYVSAGQSKGGSTSSKIEIRSAAIFQNYDSTDSQIFAIVGRRFNNSAAILRGSLGWLEIK